MAYLHKGGYNQHFLRKEITRAKTIPRNEVLLPKNATTTLRINLNAFHSYRTWNPALRFISFIIRKHFSMLFSSHRCHNIFNCAALLLPSNAATTSATFLYELNYPILYKITHLPEAPFNATSIDPMMLNYLSNEFKKADVSSISPSSERRRRANARNVSFLNLSRW